MKTSVLKHIRVSPRNDAHRMIEECMLLAIKVAVARYINNSKLPCLYRVHDCPDSTKIERLNDFLKLFSLKMPSATEPTTKEFSALLHQIGQQTETNLLQRMVLRTQQQAVYHYENRGHFGLGYDDYLHFTSPIRRYPDLIVHRTLKHILNADSESGFAYTKSEMESASTQCSSMERNAEKATRDAMDRLKCDFMQDKVGNAYTGTIVEVTNFGVFVELDDLYVQGLVHITALKSDYYHFDESLLTLVGKRTGQRYRIGDQLMVLVAKVDMDQRKLILIWLNKPYASLSLLLAYGRE